MELFTKSNEKKLKICFRYCSTVCVLVKIGRDKESSKMNEFV